MATRTLGTAATTTLTAISYLQGGSGLLTADIATIANAIKDDQTNGQPILYGAFNQGGLLQIPNRGILKVLPGDFIGVDASGWPILLSALAAANASWQHT